MPFDNFRNHETNGYDHAGAAVIEDERSFGEIVHDLTGHVRELVKGEVALAKKESVDNAKSYIKPIALFVSAGLVGLVTLFLLAHTIAWVFDEWLPNWAGFLITTVLFGIVAGVLAMVGKKALKEAQLAPKETINQAKEDVTWIKERARS